MLEYEEKSDVQTDLESGDRFGRGKRKKRQVIRSSEEEEEEDDDEFDIHIRSPLSRARASPPPTPPTLRPAQTLPSPPPTLRTSQTLPSPPPTLRTSQTLPSPPSTLRTSQTLPSPPSTLRIGQTLQSPLSTQTPTPVTRCSSPTLPPTSLGSIRDNMFIRILSLLEQIKETQKVHRKLLQTILQQRGIVGSSMFPSTPEGFPLKTVVDLQSIEQKLADQTFMSDLVAAVADIGGSTVDEATRRIMTFLLDNGLSRQYNLLGRNGKREFKALRLFEVIYGGLKKNAMTSTVTRKDAEKAVGKWLIGARDRGGNRLARATKNATPEQGPENEDN